jgi:hypothetical protein
MGCLTREIARYDPTVCRLSEAESLMYKLLFPDILGNHRVKISISQAFLEWNKCDDT